MQGVLHLLNEAVVAFHQIPSGFWQALLASGVLSPLITIWKKWRMTKREKQIAEGAMVVIVIGVCFAAATLQYLLTNHPTNPQVIALHTAILGFTLQPVYVLGFKPLWGWLSGQFGEAAKLRAEIQSAAVPPEGLPVQGTSVSAPSAQQIFEQSVPVDDFSK